jgi:hypothetical protein
MEFIKNNSKTFLKFYFVELEKGNEINTFDVVGSRNDADCCLYLLDADSTNDIFKEYNRTVYEINIIKPLSSQLQMFLSQRYQ